MASALGLLLSAAAVVSASNPNCICLATAWTALGPSDACTTHIAARCALEPELSICATMDPKLGEDGAMATHAGYLGSLAAECAAEAPFARIFSSQVLLEISAKHPLQWNVEITAACMFFYGESAMGRRGSTDPTLATSRRSAFARRASRPPANAGRPRSRAARAARCGR